MTKPYSPQNVGIELRGFASAFLLGGWFVKEASHNMFVVISVLQGPVRVPCPEP